MALPGAFLSPVGKEPKGHQGERVSTLSPPGPPPLETTPGCPQERRKTPAPYSVTGPGFGRSLASPGGSWLRSRLMRETYPFSRAFRVSPPSSPHPPQCAHWGTFPQGEGKKTTLNQEHVSGSDARGTTCRTDAPVLFPLASGSRPPTKKGICVQGCTRDFSLGVWGRSVKKTCRWQVFSGGWPAMPARSSFPESEKKCPPDLRTSRRAPSE